MPSAKNRAHVAASDKVVDLAPPPSWIQPCFPTLVDKPPTGPKWQHEVKLDGYRVSIVIDGGKATVRTRRGLDWTHRFKAITAARRRLSDLDARRTLK